jgi:hypothetical protein
VPHVRNERTGLEDDQTFSAIVDGSEHVTEGNILLVRQYEGYFKVRVFSPSEEFEERLGRTEQKRTMGHVTARKSAPAQLTGHEPAKGKAAGKKVDDGSIQPRP